MTCRVTVVFSDGERLEFDVADADLGRYSHQSAHDWLGREFEEAGCVPSNPVGKLLAADKVITLAKSRPRIAFENPTPWTREYLAATAAALGRPMVTIDLGAHTLGY
jgi:hypothetical protein